MKAIQLIGFLPAFLISHQNRFRSADFGDSFPPGGSHWARNGKKIVMERNKKLTPLSQTLRKNQTKEEARLWYQFLRKYSIPFRRQYVIGNYIVDFYCHLAKLAVELDGSQHFEEKTIEKDLERTQYIYSQGVLVLRFSNADVLSRFKDVCEKIDLCVQERIGEER